MQTHATAGHHTRAPCCECWASRRCCRGVTGGRAGGDEGQGSGDNGAKRDQSKHFHGVIRRPECKGRKSINGRISCQKEYVMLQLPGASWFVSATVRYTTTKKGGKL